MPSCIDFVAAEYQAENAQLDYLASILIIEGVQLHVCSEDACSGEPIVSTLSTYSGEPAFSSAIAQDGAYWLCAVLFAVAALLL